MPDEGNTVAQCEFPVDISNSMEVYVPLKGQLSLDDQMNNKTYLKTTVENVAAYSVCVEKDEDIEKGSSETLRINEETVGDVKIDEGQMVS